MPEETPGTGLSHEKAPLFVPQVRGSLDFARDDVFWGIVISTKRSAWRNPLMRSSTTPCKIPNLTVIQSVAWNLLERLPLKTKQYEKGTAPRPFYPFIRLILPYIPKLRDNCYSSSMNSNRSVLTPLRNKLLVCRNYRTQKPLWT